MAITSTTWKWNNGVIVLCCVLALFLAGCTDSIIATPTPTCNVFINCTTFPGHYKNITGCLETIKEYQEIERAITYARQ